MALPTPPAYTTPIPNNPFYSNPSYILEGAYYPFVIGSGLSVSPDGIISASGSGGSAVNSVTGGAGISVTPTSGNVVVTNTGVTSLIAGAGIAVSANTGSIVISSTSSAGTVTAVNSGTGLTGGPIVSTGTLAIANTGVVAATYTNPTLVINAQGQITSASNGTAVTSVSGSLPITVTPGATPTVAINAATTTNCGAVLLSDSTSSGSSTEAATSLAVKTAYDAAIAAIPKACITAKGGLVTGTAANIPVALPVGADGLVLTACAACTEGLFWGAGGGGGSTTWATLGDKDNLSGPTEIALGQNAGGSQGTYAVALGADAGCLGQGLGAISIGVVAGNSTQGTGAVAIGGAAGQSTQGDCAVALGQTAGAFNQGVEALALGSQAGVNNQASCSIVINASGIPLDNTVSGTTVIAPVRNAGGGGLPAGFFQVAYNPTTGELVYYS